MRGDELKRSIWLATLGLAVFVLLNALHILPPKTRANELQPTTSLRHRR